MVFVRSLGGIGLACIVLAGACSSRPGRAAAPPDPVINAVEDRIDAIAGRTLVVPVELGPRFDPRVPVPVRLADGRRLPAEVHAVTVRPQDPTGLWLAPAGAWETVPASRASQGAPPPPGSFRSWVLLVPLPPGATGQSLRISGKTIEPNWLTALAGPGVLRAADESALGPLILRTVPPTPATERLLDPERESPVRRWRYRLYTDGLSRAPDAVGERLRFDDPVLEAMAVQCEERWGYALRSIRRSNDDLAMRLARRLAAVADFGAGVVAPSWPSTHGEIDSLLKDLLDPRFDGPRREARANAWLETLPPANGWVIDDAGGQDAVTGGAIATVGLVNLGEEPAAAFAAAQMGGRPAEVATLPSGVVERFLIGAAESGGSGRSTLDLSVGRWSASVEALVGRVAATPPGVPVGPLFPDYSLATWIAEGAVASPDPRWLTVGLVYRRSGPSHSGGPGDWVLYLECLREPPSKGTAEVDGPSREDTARVWIGLSGRPRLVLRVGESGYAHIESVRGGQGQTTTSEAFGVSVVSRPGKWVCQIPLPQGCIESDGTLRIGIERIDSFGRRSAFPRPMLPWQNEPGRIAIDTSAW